MSPPVHATAPDINITKTSGKLTFMRKWNSFITKDKKAYINSIFKPVNF